MSKPKLLLSPLSLLLLAVPLLGARLPIPARHGEDAADLAPVIEVPSGSSKPLTVPGLTNVFIADPHVATVKIIEGNQILITGLEDGRTSLLVWKGGQRTAYTVVVHKIDMQGIKAEIVKLLGEREGISVNLVGEHIYVEGSAYTQEDYDRVQSLLEMYPNVRSFVRISPNAKKLEAGQLTAQFQRAGLRNVTARVVGTTIFLEGSVDTAEELKRADLITKALGQNVENLLSVGLRKMILADVQFVELTHTANENYGVGWPLNFSGQATLTGTYSGNLPPLAISPIGNWNLTANPISNFQLSLLMQEGYGRLLAQPKLVCASGEKAEFLAGGQIPIVSTTATTTSITYKDYGVSLKIEPTADDQGNIDMKLEGEVSEPDPSVQVSLGSGSVPGFKVRRFKTSVGVRHGESIVLSGVFQDEDAKGITKVPPFSFVPILGELFKQHNYTETKRELVVFVKPYIVTPDSERVVRMIKDLEQRYKEAKDEVNYSIFD